MKPSLTLIAFLVFVLFSIQAEAQFLKKLKDKVEDRVEQTVINKTAEKASEKASKSMDKVFDPNISGASSGNGSAGTKVIPENIPASFGFQYQYRLTMSTDDGTLDIDYYLMPGASYVGTSFSQSGSTVFMILDGDSSISYMFINAEGNKFVSATKLEVNPFEDDDDVTIDEDMDFDELTMTNLPSRTFLGYECEGRLIENDNYSMTMYFTTDAPVSFDQVYKADDKRFPKSITNRLKQHEGALMMYFEYNLKKPPKNSKNKGTTMQRAKMECTLLEAEDIFFDTTQFKSF